MPKSDNLPIQLGLLGYPLGHSLSPVLHQFFFQETGFKGTYQPFEIPPKELEDWIQQAYHSGLRGFNVTIPYKVRLKDQMDVLSPEAERIGAVNTVLIEGERLIGHNTDVEGFLSPIPQTQRERLVGQNVLVLGAGGASRAVLDGLLQCQVGKLFIRARNLDRAQDTIIIAHEMAHQHLHGNPTRIEAVTDLAALPYADFKAIINTTPVGMAPHPETTPLSSNDLAQLPKDAIIYDLIYNPLETRLLREARALNLQTYDGLAMLVAQGAQAFSLWTGISFSESQLDAAYQHLKERLRELQSPSAKG